jgi:hypothetical protein
MHCVFLGVTTALVKFRLNVTDKSAHFSIRREVKYLVHDIILSHGDHEAYPTDEPV